MADWLPNRPARGGSNRQSLCGNRNGALSGADAGRLAGCLGIVLGGELVACYRHIKQSMHAYGAETDQQVRTSC
ncbi:hypothetical protein O9992_26390 [Vibrio lentus]|nr:hypothetical protein [Vibrio lentus]